MGAHVDSTFLQRKIRQKAVIRNTYHVAPLLLTYSCYLFLLQSFSLSPRQSQAVCVLVYIFTQRLALRFVLETLFPSSDVSELLPFAIDAEPGPAIGTAHFASRLDLS